MKLYRFSPIENKEELFESIKYTHFACYELCNRSLGKNLPNSGNIGIFCHYDDEYSRLISIREEMTEPTGNPNQKYFKLYEPIIIKADNGVPETVYTHLYIRRADPYRSQVGDMDFIMNVDEFVTLKQSLADGNKIEGLRIYPGGNLDMLELYNPDVDALGYIAIKRIDN